MEKLKLNQTPIRTAESFGINDIVLEGFKVPEEITKFDSVTIKNNGVKLEENAKKKEDSLLYGVGRILEEQVMKQSNQSYKIVLNQNIKETIELNFDFQDNNRCLADYVEIIAQEGSKGTVILKYESMDHEDSLSEHYHNGICRIVAKKNSDVQVILVNLLNSKSRNFISIEGCVEEAAKAEILTVDLGGRSSVTNYYMNLVQDHAVGSINSIYLGKENQKIDMNYIAHLRGKKSIADIDVQGAVTDRAIKSFKGTLDFKSGAQQAKGNENEFCLLLSDRARSKALPMLLCTEEDVEGNHASASGKVDAKELFYVMSRGFSQKEALKLLVKARFTHIIDRIEEKELREEILAEIDKRLD